MDPVADHAAAVAALANATQDDDAAAALVADPAGVMRTAGVAVPEGSDADFNAVVQAALPDPGQVRTLQTIDGSRIACLLSSPGLAAAVVTLGTSGIAGLTEDSSLVQALVTFAGELDVTKDAPDALPFLQGLSSTTLASAGAVANALCDWVGAH
ncbi:MAG TPA: hypothetical protein VNQ77_11635 [Frankiaceae bacterium]|nr:hypothetical protein [Frankiaceae bacterium]